jgi:mono/diheme cytochrome c family protein
VFLSALGPAGRSLAPPIDIAAARLAVRAELAARPRRGPPPAPAAAVTLSAHRSGQVRVRSVSPAALAALAAATLRGPGPGSAAARALGAELFASYPFGSEEYYDPCLRSFFAGNNRDLFPALGLSAEQAPAGGRLLVGVVQTGAPGVVPPTTLAASPGAAPGRYGVTCALCHAQVDEQGVRRDGLPSRTYDQGLLLAACVDQPIHQKSGNRNLADLLDYRPGRNDSSSDGVHNPTEIPSLLGLRAFGPVRWNGDTPTLEVQIDRNLSPRSAPPEVIALVAAYLRALPLPPAAPPAPGSERQVAEGAAIFARTCQRCHAPPTYTTGEVIAQPELNTDVTRVSAVLPNSSEGYKIPSLLRIRRSAPYLHDGSIPTLSALLDLQPRSRLRTPETSGHRFGLSLPARERLALLAFLRTL